MRKLTQFALVALASSAVLSSCKKDKEEATLDRKATLQASNWDLTEYKVFTGASGVGFTENMLTGEEACDADNLTKFNATQMITTEGATKCSTTGSDTVDIAAYTLYSSNDSIRIVSDGDTEKYLLKDFSATGFTLEHKETTSGIDEITTIKMVKK